MSFVQFFLVQAADYKVEKRNCWNTFVLDLPTCVSKTLPQNSMLAITDKTNRNLGIIVANSVSHKLWLAIERYFSVSCLL